MAKLSNSLAGFLVTLMVGSQAFANASVASSTSVMQAPKKAGSNWSGFLYTSRSTSVTDYQDGTKKNGVDYLVRTNYKLNSFYFLRAQGGYEQNLEDSTFNDFTDTSLSLYSTPSPLGRNFLFSYNAGLIAPTAKVSRETNGLQTAIKTGLTMMINPSRLIPGLNIAGTLTAARNFNEFETNKAGLVNTAWSSLQTLALSYDFAMGISLSADFSHQNTWSYQNVMKDGFAMSQEIGYQLNPTFNVALGHSNSGSIYKPNGTDSNISLINENNSVVYGTVLAVF